MAYDFNGTSSLINYGAPAHLDTLSQITASAIIYCDTLGQNNVGRIFDKSPGWQFQVQTAATVSYSTTTQTVTSAGATLNAWLHAAMRFDGGTTAGTSLETFYSAIENTYITSTNASGSRTSDASSSLFIGNRAAVDRTFDGRICEVAIWNVALSNAELSSLSKGFKPPRIRPQSLVFYAPLVRSAQELRYATVPTATDTSVAAHPRVI